MRLFRFRILALLLSAMVPAWCAAAFAAGPFVPGTGHEVSTIGDDFEDAAWEYVPNFPKSSNNMDKRTRNPGGYSKNGRWFEAALRGQPDYVQRVETPPGGIPGSKGALMLRTLQSGIPGNPSYTHQQDDFIANVRAKVGGSISVSYEPSITTRVYMPPVEQWENRTGSQFAFRAGCRGGDEMEEYWPGIFIQFQSETQSRDRKDRITLAVRADGRGRDISTLNVEQTGWWTLGMSFTADGRVHYYAKPGVEDLTAADHIASYTPYSMPCRKVETFFYDVFNQDDGKTWSTAWIIDDPKLFVVRGGEQLESYGRALAKPAAPAAKAPAQAARAPAATRAPAQQQVRKR